MPEKVPSPGALSSPQGESKERLKRVVLLSIDGEEKLFDRDTFMTEMGVDGIVRMAEVDFQDIESGSDMLAHFNLEKTPHVVGGKYLIMRIQRPGFDATSTKAGQEPLLSLDGALVAECVEAENSVPYSALTPEHLAHSLKSIKDISSLRAAMQRRYGASKVDLTSEQIMSKGVGYTLFRIVGDAPPFGATS